MQKFKQFTMPADEDGPEQNWILSKCEKYVALQENNELFGWYNLEMFSDNFKQAAKNAKNACII